MFHSDDWGLKLLNLIASRAMFGRARVLVVVVGAALGTGVCLFGSSPLPQLIGVPLVIAALVWGLLPCPAVLHRLWGRLDRLPLISWSVPLLLLAALVCWVYLPLTQGHMPWAVGQADHPTHQYQAWLLVEQMLPSGRISGWSDLRWAGYPALELYPIGGPLWVGLWRALTFGLLDWEATYALAILAMLVMNVLASYVATRRFAGPWAAVVAALLVLFERGWPRQGGDHYAVDVGVWPVTMGMGPFLLTLERQWSWLLGRASTRALAAACLFAGLALLCHPMYLPVLILAAPCTVLVVLLHGGDVSIRSDRAVAAVVLPLLLGFMLAAFWYLPFLAHRGFSEPGGAPFRSLNNLGEGIAMASVLPQFWVPALVMSLVGAILAFARGGAVAFLALFSMALIFAASSTPLELSTSLAAFSASVQQERFFIPLRVMVCILAAIGIAMVFELAARSFKEQFRIFRGRLAISGLVLLGTPILLPAVEGTMKNLVVPIVEFDNGADLRHRRDLLAMCQWLREQVGELEVGQLAPRTAWYVGYGRHEYNNAPIYCGLAQIIDSPAETFLLRTGGISERELRALNVRWVIGDRPVPERDEYLRLVRRFGALHVYELRDYVPNRFTLLGTGRAELEYFSDELIRFRIHEAGPQTRLAIHISRFRNWTASMNGTPVSWTYGHLGLPRAELLHFPVTDGLLELRYEREPVYTLGAMTTLLAMMVIALIGLLATTPALLVRMQTWPGVALLLRLSPPLRSLLLVVLALAVLGSALRNSSTSRIERHLRAARPGETLLTDVLPQAQVWMIERRENSTRARVKRNLQLRWDGRFGQMFPPQILVDRHVEALELGEPRRVVAVRVAGDEEAHVRIPLLDSSAARGLSGAFARGGRGRSQTQLEVWLDHRRIGAFSNDKLGSWKSFEAAVEEPGTTLELVIRIAGRSGRAVLIDASLLH